MKFKYNHIKTPQYERKKSTQMGIAGSDENKIWK